eukprot:scaffold16_cov242-Pinguiococcus_pyrenoidosus.AAC.6
MGERRGCEGVREMKRAKGSGRRQPDAGRPVQPRNVGAVAAASLRSKYTKDLGLGAVELDRTIHGRGRQVRRLGAPPQRRDGCRVVLEGQDGFVAGPLDVKHPESSSVPSRQHPTARKRVL